MEIEVTHWDLFIERRDEGDDDDIRSRSSRQNKNNFIKFFAIV